MNEDFIIPDDATQGEMIAIVKILKEMISDLQKSFEHEHDELVKIGERIAALDMPQEAPSPVSFDRLMPDVDGLEGYKPLPIKDKNGRPKWSPGPQHVNGEGTRIVGMIYEDEVPQHILDMHYGEKLAESAQIEEADIEETSENNPHESAGQIQE